MLHELFTTGLLWLLYFPLLVSVGSSIFCQQERGIWFPPISEVTTFTHQMQRGGIF